MIIIANGYKLPQTDDDGSVFFPAIEFDIIRLSTHSHDGTNSARILAVSQTILAAAWTATAGKPGTYDQTVTMPAGISYDTTAIEIRQANGTSCYPAIDKVGAGSYKIFTNDNTQTFLAVYSS